MNLLREGNTMQYLLFIFGVLGCGIVAFWLLFNGALDATDPFTTRERKSGLIRVAIGAVLAVVAISSGYATFNSWWENTATVGVVLSHDDTVMVLTSSGMLYNCQAASECTTLKPGQLITFESRTAGGAFGQPVIRNVRVG